MAKMKQVTPENHTDHPFDNGAIGAIASVASAGVAVGAALGSAAALPGMLVGAAIGGTVGAVGSLIVAEEMDHPVLIPPKKIV
jgi:phage tail tape-measure protein